VRYRTSSPNSEGRDPGPEEGAPAAKEARGLRYALVAAVAVALLLAVLTLRDTLDLSTFPSLILITTLMRLALNVSSTRLIRPS
jgi:hypothetical protein